MPTYFTRSFAERLNSLCQIRVKEAQHGDRLKAGLALLAPGGSQMEICAVADQYRIALRAKTSAEIYAPCADITLSSVAQHFAGLSLTVILTGMGSDGKKGAVKLKRQGAQIWAQNEASCTIYGMPKAIIEAGLADKIFALDEMANAFTKISG
jgi:two-component system chemotaxis response regulator CheB